MAFKQVPSVQAGQIVQVATIGDLPSDEQIGAIRFVVATDEVYVWTGSTWIVIATAGTTSSVSGPLSSTNNAVARWDGTLGTTIQDSVVLVGDTGAISGVTSLDVSQTAADYAVALDSAHDLQIAFTGSAGKRLGIQTSDAQSTDFDYALPASQGADDTVLAHAGLGELNFVKIADTHVSSSAAIALTKLATVTASKALVSSAGGVITPSSVTSTELGYLSGVTAPTGSGALVLATSPTLVTPTLGVATATSINGLTITASTGTLTITNGKTLSVSNILTFTGTDSSSVAFGGGGTVAYTANKLSAFAATSSSELAGVISDETGSGALVFGTSPALVTPTIADGSDPTKKLSFTVSGVSAGTTRSLTVPNYNGQIATLDGAEALTNKSINGLTVTSSTGTLTITNGKTLAVSNSLTFTGTDSSSVAFGGGGTVLYSGGALGTPSSGTLTSCIGLPLTTGITGTLGIGNGGTGQTTKAAAFDALSPMTAARDMIIGGASGTGTRVDTTLLGEVTARATGSATVTMTIANPCVVSHTSHGLATGDKVYFTSTGSLPNGGTTTISASTPYYVVKIDANSYNLALTLANALAATKISTLGGSQSGTHTAFYGGLGLTSGVRGDTSGSAITGGYIGEVVTTASAITTTTASTSEADVNNASITLTPGVWHIFYSVSASYTTGTSSGDSGLTTVCITDNSNTHIGKTERIVGGNTRSASSIGRDACLAASTIVQIASSTTYKLRLKRVDVSGTGVGTVEVSSGTYDATFFAVRIA